ncbi:MAG TPA: ATP-binding protein, partial [Sphingobacteriaceae bacterium]
DGNGAALKLYGYSEEEFRKLSVRDLIEKDFMESFEKIFLKRLSQLEIICSESRHVTKSGQVLNVEVSSHVADFGGRPRRLVYVHDLTTKVKQAHQLEILNSVGKSISEELDISVILQKVTDETTKLCNAEFGAFFYNTTDAAGKAMMLYTLSGAYKEDFEKFGMPRHTSIFHPTMNEKQILRIGDVTRDPRYGQSPPHFGMPRGHLPVVSYMSVPVISNDGRVIGSLLFGHKKANVFTSEAEKMVVGVASQAAIALDNAKLYERVIELNARKDEFLSIASHELKTPMTSMKGYLQILERHAKKSNDPFYSTFLKKASLQANKLQNLVNELLDVSKIESGKMRFNFSRFKVSELLDDCVLFTSTEFPQHKIQIEGDTGMEIVADQNRIEQVVCNLISNAAKYSPDSNEIKICIGAEQDQLQFKVIDYGEGVPEKTIPHLFDRYYRAQDDYTASGLGLGLYISSEIIRGHGGEIGVHTEVGKGSSFWFTLPVDGNQLN